MAENNGAPALSAQEEAAALEAAKAAEAAAAGEETIEQVRERLAQVESEKAQAVADKAKSDEIATNQRIRAEKAEREAKGNGGGSAATESKELGTKDLYALMDAKVPQDDVDDVVEYAKFKGISIADALQSSVVKATLAEKAEKRTTAEAANTGASRRATGKIPDDVLLEKASRGELPDNDADLERLVRLRKGLKS